MHITTFTLLFSAIYAVVSMAAWTGKTEGWIMLLSNICGWIQFLLIVISCMVLILERMRLGRRRDAIEREEAAERGEARGCLRLLGKKMKKAMVLLQALICLNEKK